MPKIKQPKPTEPKKTKGHTEHPAEPEEPKAKPDVGVYSYPSLPHGFKRVGPYPTEAAARLDQHLMRKRGEVVLDVESRLQGDKVEFFLPVKILQHSGK